MVDVPDVSKIGEVALQFVANGETADCVSSVT